MLSSDSAVNLFFPRKLSFFYDYLLLQIFKNQHLSNPSLREMTVAEPFNNGQDRRVTSLIMDNVFANYDLFANNGEVSNPYLLNFENTECP